MSDEKVTQNQEPCQVFISYAKGDIETAIQLYEDLEAAGVKPWMDEEDLLPGQIWEDEITKAIKESRFFIALLSSHSVSKQGFFQTELKRALKILDQFPPGEIFFIPSRIDNCDLPDHISHIHCVDLSPSYEKGLKKILKVFAAQQQLKIKPAKKAPRKQKAESRATGDIFNIHAGRDVIFAKDQATAAVNGLDAEKPVSVTNQSKIKKTPSAAKKSETKGIIRLRRDPLVVSTDEFKKVFKLNSDRRPLEYIQNEYEDQGDVIIDHATGLMWEKAGSPNRMRFNKAQSYIDDFNSKSFAGHSDWRLPTIDELISLLEPKEKSNGLFIDPVFDARQKWCWSADTLKDWPGWAWLVSFSSGEVYFIYDYYYVRAVRSRQ